MGANHRAYSDLGWGLGRTFVHNAVHGVLLEAYGELSRTHPLLRFIYGDTGWASGGRFRPQMTHPNGLSVDFMVPLVEQGGSRELPTSVFHKWGHEEEFDGTGKGPAGQIDFEASSVHLAALARASRTPEVIIRKVIFVPELRKRLEDTRQRKSIRRLPYSKSGLWVRHDDHYQIDFEVRWRPYRDQALDRTDR